METRLTVPPDTSERRLDRYLATALTVDVSRSAIGRLIQDGRISVNGDVPRKRGHTIEPGDEITITGEIQTGETTGLAAERSPLLVLFEDEDILAIDKPPGVAVHPGPGHPTGTIVNALLGREGPLSTIGGDDRPGIVHRLDKDTSGVMLIAKNDAAHTALSRQFQSRSVEKVYVALLRGLLEPPTGVIEASLGRDPRHRQRMAVVTSGRPSTTRYRVLAQLNGGYTLAEARPQTGRPHQIRVHFASLRHPVAGDVIYARGSRDPVPRLFLHALSLAFQHPVSGETLEVRSPLAADLSECLADMTIGTTEARLVDSLG
ncbi:MAG: RluA family pseudouridine synthase [Chloroflexi bacterium]|nr:RluA family pseudouridine synthase [Chloroflexota bacterium]